MVCHFCMKKEKFNIVETLNNLKNRCIDIYNSVFGRNVFLKILGIIIAVVFIFIFLPALPSIVMNLIVDKNKVVEPTSVPQPQELGINIEQFVIEKINDEYIKTNQCNNYVFDIVGTKYIKPVGSQRFTAEVDGYSARGTEFLQASSETQWGCSLPFTAQLVVIPVKGSSFGLFVEYKDMFKILVGDGDRKTIKIEARKYILNGSKWVGITKNRPSLKNPIEDGEEVIITIKSKVEGERLLLHLDVYHSKFQSTESFDFELFPNGVNFQIEQPRVFRIGINDSRYRGEGSIIDLKTFSIKEGEW